MSALNEKRSKNKPINSEDISKLSHLPPSDPSFSSHMDITSASHFLGAEATQNTNNATIKYSSEAEKNLITAEIKDAEIGLENIFPIDSKVVHSAQLVLAAENSPEHKNLIHPFLLQAGYFTFFNFVYYATLGRFFWGNVNQQKNVTTPPVLQ